MTSRIRCQKWAGLARNGQRSPFTTRFFGSEAMGGGKKKKQSQARGGGGGQKAGKPKREAAVVGELPPEVEDELMEETEELELSGEREEETEPPSGDSRLTLSGDK